MILLAVGVTLLMLWLGVTALLVGGMWVLPTPSTTVSTAGVWRFLSGELGVWGTLRVGMVAVVWWCATAGYPLPPTVRDGLSLAVGGVILIALFNAGRRTALSSVGELLFCGALSASWMGMLALALYLLLQP
ncbi:hypothetical protein OM409_16735 [Serratia bockelmannii]|uniref:hypothetical protein n=1 Tax=Serratia bockelmannii TaxID=2703793 RepID=UPI002240BBAF|nr:hypothetical protein [Serratia bockelmannii]MCW7649160.1 hypothetical protein [Serratia bockelmannii]MCW7659205.1 hypothetical protein [Serratia bockelmannii]MCW7678989.1 hypothetical protein [Serratia bockelmannii]MCW7683766.1 hypothetical protein [Serratia bockelmannii]MCW7688543.1 hypothetical protein [Serratia bockelmannii]